MSLWSKKLDEVTYDDVVAFCDEGNKEGVQLDYKEVMPTKGISKHFASFANTRGGLIIFGVEEDRSTGLPKKYDGLKVYAKLVQQIYQQSTNIQPSVEYEVHSTDDKSGKAFVLVHIHEGISQPYYVRNDPNIWVRTGDINDPIDIASPNAVRLMFEKKEQARIARQNNLDFAKKYLDALLPRMDAERLTLIANEKADFERRKQAAVNSGNPLASSQTFSSRYYQGKIGSQASTLSIAIQPLYPSSAISDVDKLKTNLMDYQVQGRYYGDLPQINLSTMPNGVHNSDWVRHSGLYHSTQIYANGLIYDAHDVRSEQDNAKTLRLYMVAARIYMVLSSANKFYLHFGYKGSLELSISLYDVKDLYLTHIAQDRLTRYQTQVLLNDYHWQRTIDTKSLSTREDFLEIFHSVLREIYWSLGEEHYYEDELANMFKEQGWTT